MNMPESRDMYTERWIERPEVNGLAIAGFACSVIAPFTGFLLSPVALVLSLAAMFRPPRGLAIAGFILGLLGSVVLLFTVLVILLIVVVAGAAVGVAVLGGEIGVGLMVETILDGSKARDAIVAFHEREGAWPASIEELTGLEPGTTVDYWGNPYIFEISGEREEMVIRTIGKDGAPDTDDDFRFLFDLDRD